MPVYLNCITCGKEFSVPPVRAKTAKACSNECARQVRGNSRSRRVTLVCEQCGQGFSVPASHKGRRRFCSNECRQESVLYRQEISQRHQGAGNPFWKGGVVEKSDGYRYKNVGVEHPFCTKSGYMLEHRKVMEDWLREHDPDSQCLVPLGNKKYLSPEYAVHHMDFSRDNNVVENLQCMTPGEHTSLHNRRRR